MAHHGRNVKNAVPPGNLPGKMPETPPALEELSKEKTKARGRTAKTHPQSGPGGPQASEPHTPQVMRREVTRPMSAGVKKRGDRRDTQPDRGIRQTGLNRAVRHSQSNALTGKKNIGGKRAHS